MTATLSTANSTPRGAHGVAASTPTWFATAQRASIAGSTVLVGLAAGFFFTYQVSVTRGLALVDNAAYVSTFQAINDTVRTTWFGIVFFGSIPMLIATLALNWSTGRATRSVIALALLAYITTFVITAVGNVPLNDALGEVTDRSSASVANARADYEGPWNQLNLIRTLTCIASLTALAALPFVRRSPSR